MIYSALATLLNRLDSDMVGRTDVIPWSCPVPVFGDLSNSMVATIGINPSSREFLDNRGNELHGTLRRFHTLRSLGLECWTEADSRHLELIMESYRLYFVNNPYDTWFRRLDAILASSGISYYSKQFKACHLDLVPFATSRKWTSLTGQQRSELMEVSRESIRTMVRESTLKILILNGSSVVKAFEAMAGYSFEREVIRSWSLARKSGMDVMGVAYTGTLDEIDGLKLERNVSLLGFNHNLQSSFGVTDDVIEQIREWIGWMIGGVE